MSKLRKSGWVAPRKGGFSAVPATDKTREERAESMAMVPAPPKGRGSASRSVDAVSARG